MSTTDALADQLVSSFATLLAVPVRQLYALLWRVGVVEIVAIVEPQRARPLQLPGRAPTRPAPSGYRRATG